jgi:hypothetical protein
MRLLSRTLVASLGVLAVGCSDSTGPALSERVFILQSINGQPLPAILSPIPEETVSVLSAALFFRTNNEVVWTEVRREASNNVPREVTYASTLDYRRMGDRVVIGANTICRGIDLCPFSEGTLTDSGLSLTVGSFSPTIPIIYEFVEAVILD